MCILSISLQRTFCFCSVVGSPSAHLSAQVISVHDVANTYRVPLVLESQNVAMLICKVSLISSLLTPAARNRRQLVARGGGGRRAGSCFLSVHCSTVASGPWIAFGYHEQFFFFFLLVVLCCVLWCSGWRVCWHESDAVSS